MILKGITIIEGNLGQGKTLSAVAIANNNYHEHKMKIHANFDLNIPFTPIRNLDDLKKTKNGLLLLDESYQLHDARKSGSKKNLHVNYIEQNSRKQGFNIIEIAQRIDMIDKRIRDLANRIITPRVIEWRNGKPHKILWKIYKPIKIRIDKPPKWRQVKTMIITLSPEVPDLYDTHSAIYDFTMPQEPNGGKTEPGLEEKAADYWKKNPTTTHSKVMKNLGVSHSTSERGKLIALASSSTTPPS